MKVGIYGGTFDPVHFGHLNLAVQMREMHQLDQILFCPVLVNPHRQKEAPIAFHHRLKMLQLALEGIPFFAITDIESKREGPSYTIDTLKALLNLEETKKSKISYSLILGDDALPGFARWSRPEEIIKLVPILIGRRVANPVPLEQMAGSDEMHQALQKGVTPTKLVDISSTEIRQRFKQGLYCGHLLPKSVIEYITTNELYKGT